MRTDTIAENLFRFSTYNRQINLSFNQYLLDGPSPLLVHTGSVAVSDELVGALRGVLGDRGLDFVFVSHFESDECGGIVPVLAAFPQAKVICSAVSARQLAGFGLVQDCVVMAPGDRVELGERELELIAYPSEMHLWEGLIAFDREQGVLFSSDLLMRQGDVEEAHVALDWPREVAQIPAQVVPDEVALAALRAHLAELPVRFIAAGHGALVQVA